MNFYEHQARARRSTALLVGYFLLAVVLIVVAINAIAFVALQITAADEPLTLTKWFDLPYWGIITAAVLLIIVGNTLWTSLRLAGGGPALARMLGARQINTDSQDLDERRLINVVEEMSIASGVPVPRLYVLDNESGINAFVAGTRPTETIMVVTKGALEQFRRDELQGVVAHEYSHIFNDDMHINIQLMGALSGLLVIGQLGYFMLRSAGHGNNRNGGQLALIGIGVLIAGYVGLFFGSIIKAAVSRQREFLADASAVQFTRDAEGISQALYRIKAASDGSVLNNAHADDVSHFCFGASVARRFSGLMSTHPPLDERIQAVNPRFVPREEVAPKAASEAAAAPSGGGAAMGFASGTEPHTRLTGAVIAAAVGDIEPEKINYARQVQGSLPPDLDQAIHDPQKAAAVIFALVIEGTTPTHHNKARTVLATAYDQSLLEDLNRVLDDIHTLPQRRRLPLLNLALPALKSLPAEQQSLLCAQLEILIKLDQRVTIFEFALGHIVKDHLRVDAAAPVSVQYFQFSDVARELRALLSVLAHAGHNDERGAGAAFAAAWRPFALGEAVPLPPADCTLERLSASLERLAAVSPLLKKNIMQACGDCAIHDFNIAAAEAELLQAISIILDCPLPPLTLE